MRYMLFFDDMDNMTAPQQVKIKNPRAFANLFKRPQAKL